MKKITAANCKADKLYPKVVKAVAEILAKSNFVAPVDLLQQMQRLDKDRYEDWRFGRVPYLERVCVGNLSQLNRILRILELHARALGLKPSRTAYRQWGRGGKQITLRFSKSGEPGLEAAYSRHYVALHKTEHPTEGRAPAQEQDEEFHGLQEHPVEPLGNGSQGVHE